MAFCSSKFFNRLYHQGEFQSSGGQFDELYYDCAGKSVIENSSCFILIMISMQFFANIQPFQHSINYEDVCRKEEESTR